MMFNHLCGFNFFHAKSLKIQVLVLKMLIVSRLARMFTTSRSIGICKKNSRLVGRVTKIIQGLHEDRIDQVNLCKTHKQ